MKVTLIAQPMIMDPEMLSRVESPFEDFNGVADSDLIMQDAGRTCYRSWHRPNPDTRTTDDYLRKSIIDNEHYSVLEHGHFVFFVEGVSRALLGELTRHRHLSPSVESLRFVPPRGFVIHPTLQTHWEELAEVVEHSWMLAQEAYNYIYARLIEEGLPKKQAREAARMVLPLMTKTDLYISGNARSWREVISKRLDESADREIAQLAALFLAELKKASPAAFADMPEPALFTL